ncbi:hypothetical protein PTSG_08777 [Salpingoeca rosetta]|uniref:non-specific serine/threonine protein kinase n=1 Tax=Salpingoeca rosetta (strain ATCC 50818 / BSB-021) TaxID=946362 RepID=F2UKN5_SALR5|nr:uncharacterized protein PTSG_08777 [Salpingoeca rosetta]EGD77684.1 hypothetical protein PTSG_08777 [Salpingoeca rosetta]|eukprot:XP_004990160.1 hypothetical protein PTSG_08777 [Salpingoeca rosetta]
MEDDDQTVPSTFHIDKESDTDDSGDEQPACHVWGRLFSERTNFTSIELIEDKYMFGRHDSCQVRFTDKCISNVHCTISREHPQEAMSQYEDDEMLTFLTDQSANGTYVNGERLGKGRKVALAHGDKVSLLNKKHTPSYIFHDCTQETDDPHARLREKYNMSRQLGSGACGEVYLGVDKATGRKYAIKIISKRRFSQSTSMGAPTTDQLMAEVDILLRLKHPNIIHVHDMIDSQNYLYIILELYHPETRRKVTAKQEEYLRKRSRTDTQTSVLKRRADVVTGMSPKRPNATPADVPTAGTAGTGVPVAMGAATNGSVTSTESSGSNGKPANLAAKSAPAPSS